MRSLFILTVLIFSFSASAETAPRSCSALFEPSRSDLQIDIDWKIDSLSSSLRDTRSLRELMDDWHDMVTRGGMSAPPKDPDQLRSARRSAARFAEDFTRSENFRAAVAARQNPFDQTFLFNLYATLMIEAPGTVRYRTHQPVLRTKGTDGQVKEFSFMPAEQVGPAMKKFFLNLSRMATRPTEPIKAAIWIEQTLVSIHPFSDGNGRVAREFTAAYLFSRAFPRSLLDRGDENGFLSLPDADFPNKNYHDMWVRYVAGIEEHLRLLEPKRSEGRR